jgi:tellurite resistance protein
MRQMQRDDFAQSVGRGVVQQAVLRNAVPVVGVLVSAAWNQIVLRRFANQVHTAARQRLAIVRACRDMQLGEQHMARIILDGAWLMATADGDIGHQESLALAVLIDSLTLPQRIAVEEASFPDDEEQWFVRVSALEPAAQKVLIDVLSLVASADGAFTTPERRFLKRLSRTLGRSIDLRAIERLVARIRRGDAPERPPELVLGPAAVAGA